MNEDREWTAFAPTADPDERDASLERSLQLLEPPTEAEIAEQAARAKANRLDEIMRGESRTAPHPPAPPEAVIYKTNADAVRKPVDAAAPKPDNDVQAWMREATAKRGEADAQRLAKWGTRCVEISDRAKSNPRKAIEDVVMELAALDVNHARERAELTREIKVLRSNLEFATSRADAVARQADEAAKAIAQLKRDADLEKKLEEQRVRRRAQTLEAALLAAGRRPDQAEAREADLPDFREWRNAQ